MVLFENVNHNFKVLPSLRVICTCRSDFHIEKIINQRYKKKKEKTCHSESINPSLWLSLTACPDGLSQLFLSVSLSLPLAISCWCWRPAFFPSPPAVRVREDHCESEALISPHHSLPNRAALCQTPPPHQRSPHCSCHTSTPAVL